MPHVEAAQTAGYCADNARKRAGSKRVKEIRAELQKPAKERRSSRLGACVIDAPGSTRKHQDSPMAKHHKAQLEKFAQALAVGMEAPEATKVAGYPPLLLTRIRSQFDCI
jgi:hypothetical protein